MSKVLIVGANSTIAKNCLKIWANRGDTLYLISRRNDELSKIKKDLSIYGVKKVFIECLDANELNKHSSVINNAEKKMGTIDIAFIAYGTLSNQYLCENNIGEALKEIKNNAISTISLLSHLANFFEKKKSGTIAVISSVAGDRGRASNYVYGSAKAMITTFTSGLRQRLHKSNVSVVTIKAGLVDTKMTTALKKNIFWAKSGYVAQKIVQAIDKKKDEIYVPSFWFFIMLLIKIIPQKIFKKIKL
jgi:decaprenylphospho-beta-D-erythro-pentofuranosid-2-ulose 2-reductase